MESYRTEKGPRQRRLLNLGKLDLPRDQWKSLANRIEEIVTGQHSLIPVRQLTDEIEDLAQHYAALLKNRYHPKPPIVSSDTEPQYEEVDIHSIKNKKARTVGAEHVCLSTMKKLGFSAILSELGFQKRQIQIAESVIVGRMVFPSSEHRTFLWFKKMSAISNLLNVDSDRLSLNSFYRIADTLLSVKEQIESKLADREKTLFNLREKILLYDLTNTHFESRINGSRIKRYGRSKQKRGDCPLVTLGLVVDGDGFPKRSEIFEGNVSEGATLMQMVNELNGDGDGEKKLVVIDAGIAKEENLVLLCEAGYDYICVALNKPLENVPEEGFVTVRYTRDNHVEASLVRKENETVLFCRSLKKRMKEKAMQTRYQEHFEMTLESIRDGLHKKGGTKWYDKVLSRIGRAQEKYKSISYFYDIEVERQGDKAVDLQWRMKPNLNMDERFGGTYYLRTSRMDLSEQEIWNLYLMLTDLEDSFRSLKSELGLRPNFHQMDHRIEAHLFITVLAYHFVTCIQWYLHRQGIYMRWSSIRLLLSTQVRVTTEMTTRDGRKIILRNTTEPERFHQMIARSLNIDPKPLGVVNIGL